MSNPHENLYQNLLVLHELVPGSQEFRGHIKESMFAQPNQTGFFQVFYYLCHTYDPVHYPSKVPWPLLDRDQERKFRQNTTVFVKELIKEVPEANLPPFSPSFPVTPGGVRFAKFVWKFSLLVLKTVVERESVTPILQYPRTGLSLVRHLTHNDLKEIAHKLDDLYGLLIDSKTFAKRLSNKLHNHVIELKELRSQLNKVVQGIDDSFISENDKSTLCGNNQKAYHEVMEKWQAHLDKETVQATTMLMELHDQSAVIKSCHESVKALVNSKTLPLVLDVGPYLDTMEDSQRGLILSDLFYEAANAICILMKSLSMCGGIPSLNPILPSLVSIGSRMQDAEDSLAEIHAGFVSLITETLQNLKVNGKENCSDSPPLNGRLQHAYEMLEEAQISTPPLIFNIHSDMPLTSRLVDQSPPVGVVVPSRLKPSDENGQMRTPTNSKKTYKPNCILRTTQKTPAILFQTKNGMDMQTPANFQPKQTSTGCKRALSDVISLNFHSSSNQGNVTEVASNPIKSDLANGVKTMLLPIPTKTKPLPDPKPVLLLPGAKEESSGDHSEKMVVGEIKEDGQKFHLKCQERGGESPNSAEGASRSDVLKLVAETLAAGRETDTVLLRQFLKPETLPTTPAKTSKSDNEISSTSIPVGVVMDRSGKNSLFDSPCTSPMIVSPASRDSSFFTTDVNFEASLADSLMPPRNLNLNFDDGISPSGRVSLCPPCDLQLPHANEEKEEEAAPEPPPASGAQARRRSLQALIHRYRELVASSKQNEVQQLSPPCSPVLDLSTEDLCFGTDIKIDGLDSNF